MRPTPGTHPATKPFKRLVEALYAGIRGLPLAYRMLVDLIQTYEIPSNSGTSSLPERAGIPVTPNMCRDGILWTSSQDLVAEIIVPAFLIRLCCKGFFSERLQLSCSDTLNGYSYGRAFSIAGDVLPLSVAGFGFGAAGSSGVCDAQLNEQSSAALANTKRRPDRR